MDNSYEKLKPEQKVRVNAVILDAIEKNRPAGFAKDLSILSGKVAGQSKAEGFQSILDAMRDSLARDIRKIPDTGTEIKHPIEDLGRQREVFQAIKGSMVPETGTENYPYKSAEYYQRVANGASLGLRGKDMPEPEKAYTGSMKAVLTGASMIANGCVTSHDGSIACSAPAMDNLAKKKVR